MRAAAVEAAAAAAAAEAEAEVDGVVVGADPIVGCFVEVKRSRRAAAEIPLASTKSPGRRRIRSLEKRDGEGESGRRAAKTGRMERDHGRERERGKRDKSLFFFNFVFFCSVV